MRPFRVRSRPLQPGDGKIEGAGVSDPSQVFLPSLQVVPCLEALVVSPASALYQEARQLQEQRFARASKPGPKPSYLETVDAQHTLRMVIRRRDTPQPNLIGTALLEFPPASVIASVAQFQPKSPSAQLLSRGTFAEIRGLATSFDLDWQTKLALLDSIGSLIVLIARQRNVESLWLVARYPLMSLLLAEIPGLLPPYHFTLCTDVLGWNEESERLQQMRKLRMKELPMAPDTLPTIFQITPSVYAEDLEKRLALLEQRQHAPELPELLQSAMRQSRQSVQEQIARLQELRKPGGPHGTRKGGSMSQNAPAPRQGEGIPRPPTIALPQKEGSPGEPQLLPFGPTPLPADHLQQVIAQGGAEVARYKTLSYDLLQIEPGMQVLDIGCGAGVDLLALAERVGQEGQVVGLDPNHQVLKTARDAASGHVNVLLVAAGAEQMPFITESFDRARTDRVLQHIPQASQALGEIWRVLRPGGIVTLVEPDWQMMAVYPGSADGGDNDHTFQAVLQWCHRHLAHPFMGRQLSSLFRQPDAGTWEVLQLKASAFTFTTWSSLNTILQITETAKALISEEPSLEKEIGAWLQTLKAAEERSELLASFTLFYITARKVVPGE